MPRAYVRAMNLLTAAEFLEKQKNGCVVLDTRAPEIFAERFLLHSISLSSDENFAANLQTLVEDETQLLFIAEEPQRAALEQLLQQHKISCEGFLAGSIDELFAAGAAVDMLIGLDAEEFKLDYRYDEFFLIDTRSAESFAEAHIEDAENIAAEDLQDALEDMDANASYYVYGANAADAMTAASQFRNSGCTKVRVVAAGFAELQASGVPCFTKKKKREEPFSKN